MVTSKGIFAMASLAAVACQPSAAPDLGIAGARLIEYDMIRTASGVLGYSEPLLGPKIATSYSAAVGPGSSSVDVKLVAGAWELPPSMRATQLEEDLRTRGKLERVREYRDGQLWIADYQMPGAASLRLLFIDGTSYRFEQDAVPEVRPGPHVYLIAYRKP